MEWRGILVYDESSPSRLRFKEQRGSRRAGDVAGNQRKDGYWQISSGANRVLGHRVIYEMFNGPIPDGMQVDHEDGDCTNNCPENLRLVTPKVNQRNMRRDTRNTSGVTGVSRKVVKGRNREFAYWTAHWIVDGVQQTANFPVTVHGEEESRSMAVAARQLAIEKLNTQGAGYTERHGSD